MTRSEWIKYFEQYVDSQAAKRLADKITEGYPIFFLKKEEEFDIVEGGQHFGSGGYHAGFKVWFPAGAKIEDIAEIVDKDYYRDSFIWKETLHLKPKQPFIISYSERDAIGEGRTFGRAIYVFGLPNPEEE